MTTQHAALCRHCLLPVGRRAMHRTVNGESCAFCCYGCCIAHQVQIGSREEYDAAWQLVRLGIGAFLSMNIMLFSLLLYTDDFRGADAQILTCIHLLLWLFATPAVLLLGEPFLRETWRGAREGRLNAAALIVLGVAAAYAYSVFAMIEGSSHLYFDTASMVLMLFTVGHYLDAAGRARAARDLQPLLAAEHEWATVLAGDEECRMPAREVAAGMLVRVRPGERIPIDGVVVEGRAHADEALMTGESRPIAKGIGATVIAGSVSLDGPMLIRSSGAGNQTRWAQICRAVRDALLRRSPSQRLADSIVGVFVPMVLVLAAGTAMYWSQHLSFDRALVVGLAVLVVACPCAVGLAAPMATSLGIGRLARHGCLVRDPAALEKLALARVVAFDKTGTLTAGSARLVGIDCEGRGADEVLGRAAALERYSEHCLARPVIAAARVRGLSLPSAWGVRVVPGRGVRGYVEGEETALGNATFMAELRLDLPHEVAARGRSSEASGLTVVYVGWSGKVRAVLSLDDVPLPEARAMIELMRRRGVRAALLTGDQEVVAQRIAASVGIDPDAVRPGLMPEAKREELDRLRRAYGVAAMVGDGLNDGPVLAMADVGIAVGTGTDLARETAAVVLPSDRLWMLPWVIDVARAVRAIILTNLMWAFGYNLIAVSLAMLGILQPVFAAAVMAGSSIVVVLNSLRLERLPEPAAPEVPRASRVEVRAELRLSEDPLVAGEAGRGG